VGKIGVSDAILGKQGPLTEEEWAVMRRHPEIGVRMLSGIDFLADVLPVIRHHHERWDGNGYPKGLAGDAIPLGARIVAVCDAFDAMVSDRPYRRAMSVDDAYAEILACSGTQFDPKCAAVLTEVIKKMGLQGHFEEKLVRFAS
jgi:HD-GYP domain-containing protein (c-di-GMP phosphodiesterase class II)